MPLYYPREVIYEVNALNDIVDIVSGYVTLKQQSSNYFGLCPFHNEKSPSFSVNRDKQIFYCFGCGAGGNAISFIMRIENMDFPDALKILAERVNYILPEAGNNENAKLQAAQREKASGLNTLAARFYHQYLYSGTEEAAYARNYLRERNVDEGLIRKFGLGLSPPDSDSLVRHLRDHPPQDLTEAGLATAGRANPHKFYDRFRNRLMFPIIDRRGRIVGFGGRILKESDTKTDYHEPKYLNTPETVLFKKSEQLYGLNIARKIKTDEYIIAEGYMDVLAMHQYGFKNTVGVLGTAINEAHMRALRSAGCVNATLLLDSDEAGTKAALRAIPVLVSGGIKVKVLQVPNAKDPDEYLQKFGARALMSLLAEAKNHIAFQIDLLRRQHDLTEAEGRIAFTKATAELLSSLPSAIESDVYAQEIANSANISLPAIQQEIQVKRNNKPRQTQHLEYPLRPRFNRTKDKTSQALMSARKALLHLLLDYPIAAKALKEANCISDEEIGGGIFAHLLQLAYENADDNMQLNPADIMSLYEDQLDQQMIAEIFIKSFDYKSPMEIQIALNDMVKKISLDFLSERMAAERHDLSLLQTLGNQRKAIEQIHIPVA